MLKATLANIKVAAKILKQGGLVVYPTDTVYGLGCNPFDVDAVERLIRVKGARDKPLPVLACNLANVKRIAELSSDARKIGEQFWPGPLTLVLPKKLLSDVVTFGLATVGVRIPNNEVALELIRCSGGLLVGTSANKTGSKPPTSVPEISRQLGGEVDVILDGGVTELGGSSTVLDLSGGKVKVLRKGCVSLEDVLESLGKCV